MSNAQRHVRALVLALAAPVCVALATACEGEDEASPKASLLLLHESQSLGSVEVLLDEEVVATLAPGAMEGPISVDTGDRVLALRNPGASRTLVDRTLNLGTQPYLVAFHDDPANGRPAFWVVDEPAPVPGSDEAVVQVVNLDPDDFKYDVYVGDGERVAEKIGPRRATAWTVVPAGPLPVRVFNSTDDPRTARPVTGQTFEFDEGAAVMLLLQSTAEGLKVRPIQVE